jgi:hypothetical protein
MTLEEFEIQFEANKKQMDAAFQAGMNAILGSIVTMVEKADKELIDSLSPEAEAINREGNQHSEICSDCDHR